MTQLDLQELAQIKRALLEVKMHILCADEEKLCPFAQQEAARACSFISLAQDAIAMAVLHQKEQHEKQDQEETEVQD